MRLLPTKGSIELSAPKRCGSDWPPFTGTSPKSLSSHLSDRAHMRGRVPRLARYTRGRSGKPREHRGNLVHLVAADRARPCPVFCSLGGRNLVGLLRRRLRSRSTVLVQMTPMELLRSFRRMRRSVPEGLGQSPRPHSPQAFASRAACCHKTNYCPRMSL